MATKNLYDSGQYEYGVDDKSLSGSIEVITNKSKPCPICRFHVRNKPYEVYKNKQKNFIGSVSYNFDDEALLMIKEKLSEYNSILYLVRSVDLSNNKFSGEIPIEMTNLTKLQSLDISYNLLIGRIPENIGFMRSLESIDFSGNHLCGEIPQSMSSLTFLSHLNLSNNNLTGKIPLSTQLQSLDPSSFLGNDLCGSPLLNNCTATILTPNFGSGGKDGSEHEVNWFYLSMTLGFIVGFWSVIGPLIVNRRWRYKYCHFLDQLGDKFVYVVRKCG